MAKTKTKTKRIREDHAVNFRLSPKELIAIQENIQRIKKDSGIEIKPGAFAKHAALSYARQRRIELAAKEAVANEDPDAAIAGLSRALDGNQ